MIFLHVVVYGDLCDFKCCGDLRDFSSQDLHDLPLGFYLSEDLLDLSVIWLLRFVYWPAGFFSPSLFFHGLFSFTSCLSFCSRGFPLLVACGFFSFCVASDTDLSFFFSVGCYLHETPLIRVYFVCRLQLLAVGTFLAWSLHTLSNPRIW